VFAWLVDPEFMAAELVLPGLPGLVLPGLVLPGLVLPEVALSGLVPAVDEPERAAWSLGRACGAVLTAGSAADPAVEATEAAAGCEPRSGGGSVDACACRENTSMMTTIPATAIAIWIAR
jgi:hypothetical protein